jgi:hypothetical protein
MKWDWEVAGMHNMLCCIYHHTQFASVPNLDALETLARLADFYGSSPAVSESLDGLLLRNQDLFENMAEPIMSIRFLAVACKLRNKTLYKESMTLIAGRWTPGSPTSELLATEPKIRRRAVVANAGILVKISEAQNVLLQYSARANVHRQWPGTYEDEVQVKDFVVEERTQHYNLDYGPPNHPEYFRLIHEDDFQITGYHTKDRNIDKGAWDRLSMETAEEVRLIVGPLLENNLKLSKGMEGAGQGVYKDCFLCAEIEDEDLPWNPLEIDF